MFGIRRFFIVKSSRSLSVFLHVFPILIPKYKIYRTVHSINSHVAQCRDVSTAQQLSAVQCRAEWCTTVQYTPVHSKEMDYQTRKYITGPSSQWVINLTGRWKDSNIAKSQKEENIQFRKLLNLVQSQFMNT